jgi:nucleoside-diphosphate-sugar epimerase
MPGEFMILGAGGKMGLHVCLMLRQALDASGDSRRVVAVSRFGKASAREEFQRHGIVTVPCDLCQPDQLEELEDMDNIIFMAGAKFGTSDRPGLLKQMNEDMPTMVAERFSGARITAFSTGCVYSFQPVNSPGSTEGSETEPVGSYARSCLGREMAFRRAAQTLGTRVALIRLNYAVEFRYGVPVDLAQKILKGEPIDVSMGYANLIWQRDAVAHSILAHELASTVPFLINVTGPGTHRVRDLAAQLGALLGRKPAFIGQEADTAWISDASLSHRLFGLPETSLDQMLEWVAAWQMAELPTLNKPTGFEKRDGNF